MARLIGSLNRWRKYALHGALKTYAASLRGAGIMA